MLSQHRLYEFERVFDRYRAGRTSAEHVSSRGRKLIIGKKIGKKNKRKRRRK